MRKNLYCAKLIINNDMMVILNKIIYVTLARKDNSLRINRLVGLHENWVTR